MNIDLHNKFMGAMLGSALGDAVGELAFRVSIRDDLLAEIDGSEELNYTDDTAMAIALAEALIARGDIDQQILGDTFRKHYYNEPWRGYGAGPPQVFTAVEQEAISYNAAAARLYDGNGSYGNGAAMRITPLALLFCNSDQLYDKVRLSAEVTHTHPVGIDGAAVLAKAIAKTVELNPHRPFSPQKFVGMLIDFARTSEIKDKLTTLIELIDSHVDAEQAAERLGTGVAVHESMPFALYCFLTHPHAYLECVLCAILHGGDRDTIGAMAGAVCGAYLGSDAIPEDWQKKLENSQHIETFARELAARTTL